VLGKKTGVGKIFIRQITQQSLAFFLLTMQIHPKWHPNNIDVVNNSP
jgi:hypothetical protein